MQQSAVLKVLNVQREPDITQAFQHELNVEQVPVGVDIRQDRFDDPWAGA